MSKSMESVEKSRELPTGGAPLGPDSLTWRYLGDVRSVFVGTRAGLLQAMHPSIGAALVEHSDFFKNPFNRLLRSAGPILGVVYDHDGGKTGTKVRKFHDDIKGMDAAGRRYHALDPSSFFWAHATFFEGQIAAQEHFGTPLTRQEKEQLYRESITWYSRYGLTMSPVPKDYAAFEAYYAKTIAEVLEPTKAARISIRKPKRTMPAPLPALKGPAWTVLGPLLVDSAIFLSRATLPARAREKLEITLTEQDERNLRRIGTSVRLATEYLPSRLRYLPRAHRAIARARAERTES